jgi:RNA polymerase-binding transcription factor DksA
MPLTREQLRHLEQRLLDERARAEALLNQIVEERAAGTEFAQSGDLSVMPFHPADRGTDASDEDLSLSNATRASAELGEIDAALDRLRKAPMEFGRCENTARVISLERLELIPWARTCE